MANTKKNYNKISAEKVEKEAAEQVVEVTESVESAEPETTKVVAGKVTNCSMLNMRKKPAKNADIITKLNSGTNVEVFPNESTKSWYKIKANGVEGFCMVEYITLSE